MSSITYTHETDAETHWNDILNSYGHLELCIGCMFSGKTTFLLDLVQRFNNEFKDFLLVKPIIDNRYNTICYLIFSIHIIIYIADGDIIICIIINITIRTI